MTNNSEVDLFTNEFAERLWSGESISEDDFLHNIAVQEKQAESPGFLTQLRSGIQKEIQEFNKIKELIEHDHNYRFLKKIGSGLTGNVYSAEHLELHCTRAFKILRDDYIADPQALARFKQEKHVIGLLNHQNIVRAIDTKEYVRATDKAEGDIKIIDAKSFAEDIHGKEIDRQHVLIMEFIEGEDIEKFIKSGRKIPIEDAIDIICEVAQGLHHANEKEIVHRDIKPGNIILTKGKQAKILDFGFGAINEASPLTDSHETVDFQITKAGMRFGSPHFMSPEQHDDPRSATIKSDIYSLGCTFYYMVVGVPPFSGKTVPEQANSHRSQPMPSFRDSGIIVSEVIEDILQKMCAKTPDERYKDPQELLDAIQEHINNRADLLRRTEKREAIVPVSDITSLADMRKISQSVSVLLPELKDSVLSNHFQGKKYLFALDAGRSDISITVSSQVLGTLLATKDGRAHDVCNAILMERNRNGYKEGVWEEGGNRSHIMNVVWPIYACLQSQPSRINELKGGINWLINALGDEGCGFRKGWPGKVFYTALAIQTLIEAYNAHSEFQGHDEFCDKIKNAIERGTNFLLSPNIRHQLTSKGYLWKTGVKTQKFCLAGTSMAIHVLSKLKNSGIADWTEMASNVSEEEINETLYALCLLLENGIPADRDEGSIPDGPTQRYLTYWPQFSEDGGNYWFRYFTPLLVITLIDGAKNIELNRDSVVEKAVLNMIRWIIGNIEQTSQGKFVSIKNDVQYNNDLWPSAQSIVILHRWQDIANMLCGISCEGSEVSP